MIRSPDDGDQPPEQQEEQRLLQRRAQLAPAYTECLFDYFAYVTNGTILIIRDAIQALSGDGIDLAELVPAFEPALCDQEACSNARRFMACLCESSQVTIGHLINTARRSARAVQFNALIEALAGLADFAHNDSLFRYLRPGYFVTDETLQRDLHPSLLESKFNIFYSSTFRPKRHLVNAYLHRLSGEEYRDLVVRGYNQLFALAGFPEAILRGYANASHMLGAALQRVRSQSVQSVLQAILAPQRNHQAPAAQAGSQLYRLGHLIAFALGHPELEAEPQGCLCRSVGFLKRAFGRPFFVVSRQFVLRLSCNVIVVDEYANGQPSEIFARLICTFQQAADRPVRLAEHGVFVAPYCEDRDMRQRFFGSDDRAFEMYQARQLEHPSVRAVIVLASAAFASRAAFEDSLERRLLTACLEAERELLLVMDESAWAQWPEALNRLLEKYPGLVNTFTLPENTQADEIAWRNFLVCLTNLVRPPLPPQTQQMPAQM